MGEPTGVQIAERALKAPLVALGWRPRAAGWFTRSLTPEWTAVVYAVTNGAGVRGHAKVDLGFGLHHVGIENAVQAATGYPTSYQRRTFDQRLSLLRPRSDRGARLVNAETADRVAAELVGAFDRLGTPWLERVSSDAAVALELSAHAYRGSAAHVARYVLTGYEFGGEEERLERLDRIRERVSSERLGNARDDIVATFQALAQGTGIVLPDTAREERPATELEGYGTLVTSAETIASDLRSYGEEATAEWIITCSNDDLARVCTVASWLVYNGPGTKTRGMLFAKAGALAAVYIREGSPRNLARSRRRKIEAPPPNAAQRFAHFTRAIEGDGYPVRDDARNFWRADSL